MDQLFDWLADGYQMDFFDAADMQVKEAEESADERGFED